MPGAITPADVERDLRVETQPSGGGGDTHGRTPSKGYGGDGGPIDPDSPEVTVATYRLGAWIGLAGIVMIFGAFTSAMVVRKGISGDWESFDLPWILWFSTAVLIASSYTIHRARSFALTGPRPQTRRWMGITATLGAVFLLSQLLGWLQLAERGLFLATNPSSSFFYILTGTHGLHLLGGVLAMGYALYRLWSPRRWVTERASIEATAIYWHFLDGLWLYIMALLLIVG